MRYFSKNQAERDMRFFRISLFRFCADFVLTTLKNLLLCANPLCYNIINGTTAQGEIFMSKQSKDIPNAPTSDFKGDTSDFEGILEEITHKPPKCHLRPPGRHRDGYIPHKRTNNRRNTHNRRTEALRPETERERTL